MNLNNNIMTRLNDLNPQTRLDLIEESRWQFGQEHVAECIADNAEINGMCDWSKTRQGAAYWAWIDAGSPDDSIIPFNNRVFDPLSN
jgi:hypothetical protein